MQQLFRLANVVGLDTDNTQHSIALKEAMHEIKDPEAFIEYCRDHKETIKTFGKHEKAERLDTLATRYKKLQDQADLPHAKAELSSKTLDDLFANLRMWLKNEVEVGKDPDLKKIKLGGDLYFTDAQADALIQIGSNICLIELSEQNKLKTEIKGLFMSKYIKKSKYASLTQGQQKIAGMIGSIR